MFISGSLGEVCELLGVGFGDGRNNTDATTRCTVSATHFYALSLIGQSNCESVYFNPREERSPCEGLVVHTCSSEKAWVGNRSGDCLKRLDVASVGCVGEEMG